VVVQGLAVPRRSLLACGLLYAVLYPIVNDVIAANLYDGYSRMDQAVSELSAVGAPARAFLTATVPVFSLLSRVRSSSLMERWDFSGYSHLCRNAR